MSVSAKTCYTIFNIPINDIIKATYNEGVDRGYSLPPPAPFLPPPTSWKHKMKNKSGQKSVFLYFYYLWSTFLNSCFLNDHFHHLSLPPSSWQGKLNFFKLFIHIFFGGGSVFSHFTNFSSPTSRPSVSHLPPLPPTSLPSFSHLPPPFLPPPFVLSAPSIMSVRGRCKRLML